MFSTIRAGDSAWPPSRQPAPAQVACAFRTVRLAARNCSRFRRFAAWGGAAALALAIVVLISQTPIGSERLQLALAQTRTPEPQAIASVPPRVVVDAEETRRLAEAVRRLAADRDRLQRARRQPRAQFR